MRFVRGQVGDDQAGETSVFRTLHEVVGTEAEDDRIADHRDERRNLVTAARQLLDAGEDVVDVQTARQGARVAGLNHRAVGNRVAVGEADFDQIDASAGEFADQRH